MGAFLQSSKGPVTIFIFILFYFFFGNYREFNKSVKLFLLVSYSNTMHGTKMSFKVGRIVHHVEKVILEYRISYIVELSKGLHLKALNILHLTVIVFFCLIFL